MCERLGISKPDDERYPEFTILGRAFDCNMTLYEEYKDVYAYSAPIRYFSRPIRPFLMAWMVEAATVEERAQLRAFIRSVRAFEQTRETISPLKRLVQLVRNRPTIAVAFKVRLERLSKRGSSTQNDDGNTSSC